jgi:hypothetical protein
MQKAYASYQFIQTIGRFSWFPTAGVHVTPFPGSSDRFELVGAMFTSSDAAQPVS